MKSRTRTAFIAGLMVIGLLASVAPAVATETGGGCTPGYWKNHTEDWVGASAGDSFEYTFGVTYDANLHEALQGGGGKGLAGAQKILARAAVAAYLNAMNPDVDYPWGVGWIAYNVQKYFGGWHDETNDFRGNPWGGPVNEDRAALLEFASYLDGLNNLGCSL